MIPLANKNKNRNCKHFIERQLSNWILSLLRIILQNKVAQPMNNDLFCLQIILHHFPLGCVEVIYRLTDKLSVIWVVSMSLNEINQHPGRIPKLILGHIITVQWFSQSNFFDLIPKNFTPTFFFVGCQILLYIFDGNFRKIEITGNKKSWKRFEYTRSNSRVYITRTYTTKLSNNLNLFI